MKPNFKKFLSALAESLWPVFLVALKNKIVQAAIKKFIGTAVTGGFKVWLVTYLAENFADEIVIPVMNGALAEGKYIVHSYEGKMWVAKLQRAQDVTDYNSTVDDINS